MNLACLFRMETILEKQRHSTLHLCFQLKRLNFALEITAVKFSLASGLLSSSTRGTGPKLARTPRPQSRNSQLFV
jgi:hypothetical protein